MKVKGQEKCVAVIVILSSLEFRMHTNACLYSIILLHWLYLNTSKPSFISVLRELFLFMYSQNTVSNISCFRHLSLLFYMCTLYFFVSGAVRNTHFHIFIV